MIYIFDRNEVLLEILDNDKYYNDRYKRQINKEWSFAFSIDIKESINIKKKNKVGFFDVDGNFQLFVIEELEDDFINDVIKTVICFHDFYSLQETIIEDKRIVNGTANNALIKALEGTKYKVGNVAQLGEYDINYYYISNLKAVNSIIDKFGGELNFRLELNDDKTKILNRYVDILYRHGEDTGIRFTFDSNITAMKRTISNSNHFTVLYGMGKSLETDAGGFNRKLKFGGVVWGSYNPTIKPEGDNFVVDKEAVKKWGRIEGIYENGNIEDANELLKATWESLQKVKEPKISYSANIEELSYIDGYEHFKVVLGDTVILLSEEYDLVVEVRIIEESYSIRNTIDKDIIMGSFLDGITDNAGGTITDSIVKDDVDINIDDTNFPDTLPSIPVVIARGLFSSVSLEWTFENKSYYVYELFASKIENFTPDPSNLIYKGKASAFLHEVKPKEIWYYRARCGNTHNKYTEYSLQVEATTLKISDGADYFEEAAIGHAVIGSLDLDKAIVGMLRGTFIDARDLSVTDGNGDKTLHVDSFGNVNLNVKELKILSKDVATDEDLGSVKKSLESSIKVNADGIKQKVSDDEFNTYKEQTANQISEKVNAGYVSQEITKSANQTKFDFSNSGGFNLLKNSAFGYSGDYMKYWSVNRWQTSGGTVSVIPATYSWGFPDNNVRTVQINGSNMSSMEVGIVQDIPTARGSVYTFSFRYSGHRASGASVVVRSSDYQWIASVDITPQNHTGGNNTGNWGTCKIQFTAVGAVTRVDILVNKFENDGYMWIAKPIVNAGPESSAWTGHKDEIYSGYTTVDAGGVTVTNGALKVKNNAGQNVFEADALGNLNMNMYGSKLKIAGTGNRGSTIQTDYYDKFILEVPYYQEGSGIWIKRDTGATILTDLARKDNPFYKVWIAEMACPAIKAEQIYVTGSKNCLQTTENYGERLINAYETAEYYFGDIGGGIIKNGECIVMIDDILQECINTDLQYHVFTQIYNGAITKIEKYKTYFIVHGTDDTEFSWELKAKRIGYENNRLELVEIEPIQQAEDEFNLLEKEQEKNKELEDILLRKDVD